MWIVRSASFRMAEWFRVKGKMLMCGNSESRPKRHKTRMVRPLLFLNCWWTKPKSALEIRRRWQIECDILHANLSLATCQRNYLFNSSFRIMRTVFFFAHSQLVVWKKGVVSMAQDLCWIFKIDANTIFFSFVRSVVSLCFFLFVIFVLGTDFCANIFNAL